MAKTIDYAVLTIASFLLTFAWAGVAVRSFVVALIIALAMSAMLTTSVYYLSKRSSKPYPTDRLAIELSIQKPRFVIDLLLSVLKNTYFENGLDYILLKNAIFISLFKFSQVNTSDVGRILELTNSFGKNQVFILARGIDRRVFGILDAHNVKAQQIKIKEFYRFLKKRNALPPLNKIKPKLSLRSLLGGILSRNNTRSYLFSGVTLIGISFVTPLQIYYVILGSICLILSLLTLTPLCSNTHSDKRSLERLFEPSSDADA